MNYQFNMINKQVLLGLILFFLTFLEISAQRFSVRKSSESVVLSGKIISSNLIVFNYKTLSSSKPLQDQHWVAIWQGSQIHYDQPPLRRVNLSNSGTQGNFVLDSLNLTNLQYILGYGVGPNISNAAATIHFPEGIFAGTSRASSIKIQSFKNGQLIFLYDTPLGNAPHQNGHWVGLVKGRNPFGAAALLSSAPIMSNIASDTVSLQNINLKKKTWYSVFYCTGPDRNETSAIFRFKLK